jgi:hypothetical protein
MWNKIILFLLGTSERERLQAALRDRYDNLARYLPEYWSL